MATTSRKDITGGLNPQILQEMQEPLLVRIERVKGNARTPIDVPAANGTDMTGSPGTNWSRDGVLKLETWLATEWSGGGIYHLKVVDANGKLHEWQSVFDPRVYPERTPPSIFNQPISGPNFNQPGVQPMPPAAPSAPAQQHPHPSMPAPMGQSPAFLPPFLSQQQQQQPQQQLQQQPQQQANVPWSFPMMFQPQPSQPIMIGVDSWGRPMYGASPAQPAPAPTARRTRFDSFDEDEDRPRRPPTWMTPAAPPPRPVEDIEKRRMEEEIKRLEVEKRDAEHRAALDRVQQEHARQLEAMRQEFRAANESKVGAENDEVRRAREDRERMEREREREKIDMRFEQIANLVVKMGDENAKLIASLTTEKGAGTNDQVRRLEDEMRRRDEEGKRERVKLEADAQRERDRNEAERREERIRLEMKETAARTEALLHDAKAGQTDPMITFMQEQSRQNAESMREIARLQQSSSAQMAGMMMSPQAIATLMRDASGGADALLKNVVSSYSGIFDTMKNAIHQIGQMATSDAPSPAVQMIQEGIGRASDMADRYMKSKQAQVEAESRAKMAQSQAEAVKAQAAAHMTSNARAAQVAQFHAQQEAAASAKPKANGSSSESQQQVKPQTKPAPAQAAAAGGGLDGATDNVVQMRPVKQAVNADHDPVTDQDMFGIALESVTRLRLGVKAFLDANNGDIAVADPVKDAEGKIVGLTPDGAIDAILQGVNYVTEHNIVVPVFTLFQTQRFADFIDVMLPTVEGIPQAYRDECVRILSTEVDVDAAPGDDDVEVEDDNRPSA